MRKIKVRARHLYLLQICLVTAVALAALLAGCGPGAASASLTTYHYDAEKEAWLKDVQSVELQPNSDGTQPEGGNTVIIRLDANNPVKQIVVFEGLVIGGSEPRLEIAGHDTGGAGKLNIGTLLLRRVDADKLDVDNTDVVRVQMDNVVAHDNELDVDVDLVNVVRTGRGGASNLFVGILQSDLADFLKGAGIPDLDSLPANPVTSRETGVRVDRIRILGPSSGEAFVERIIILNSSVFGTIHVHDVDIQDLILKDVSLDDSV